MARARNEIGIQPCLPGPFCAFNASLTQTVCLQGKPQMFEVLVAPHPDADNWAEAV